MKVLKTIISEAAELKERYLPEMNYSGLFVPRATDLSVGEDVCVWCLVRSHSAELHILGTVYWVRHRSGQQRQKLVPGAGIGFKSGNDMQISFLERVIAGDAEPFSRRRSPRTPLLSPWRCRLASPGSTEARPAMLADISKGGALAVLGQQALELGNSVHLALPWHSHTHHEMKVAWRRDVDNRWRVGLTRLRSGPAADQEWADLVSEARKVFTSQVCNRGNTDPSLKRPSGLHPKV